MDILTPDYAALQLNSSSQAPLSVPVCPQFVEESFQHPDSLFSSHKLSFTVAGFVLIDCLACLSYSSLPICHAPTLE